MASGDPDDFEVRYWPDLDVVAFYVRANHRGLCRIALSRSKAATLVATINQRLGTGDERNAKERP